MNKDDVIIHYDTLIDLNNDPVHDPEPLKEHMDKWDGAFFIEKLNLQDNDSVLEIGVGTGRLAVRVAPYCHKFYGIDVSPKTIERATLNLSAYHNCTFICGDFLDYNFENAFHVIYSSLTFMHIENKLNAIQKVFSLLTKPGRFVLSIDKNQKEYIDIGVCKTKVFPDNPEHIINCLKVAGFSSIEQYEREFSYILVADIG